MTDQNRNPEPFLALVSVMNAFCHKIRTPLSVIINEIACLELSPANADLSKSKTKASEISAFLKLCSQVGSSPDLHFSTITVQELLAPLKALEDIFLEIPHEVKESNIEADKNRSILALKLMCQTFQEYGRIPSHRTAPRRVEVSAGMSNSGTLLELIFRANLNLSQARTVDLSLPLRSNSLCSLFFKELRWDSIYPPIIDTIMWAHGWRLEAFLGNAIRVKINLPLQT